MKLPARQISEFVGGPRLPRDRAQRVPTENPSGSARLLLVVLLGLPLIQGCQQTAAAGAYAAWGLSRALSSKPDQKLDYAIDVKTNDGDALNFQGSTECPHIVGNDLSGFSTKAPSSVLDRQGERWVLTGINCQNEIVHKRQRDYALYRSSDGIEGKIYYLMDGGSAQLSRASFESSVQQATKGPASYFDGLGSGPYVYQKVFLGEVPAALKGQQHPLVAYDGLNVCAAKNSAKLALTKSEFYEQFRRGLDAVKIEEGILVFERRVASWAPRRGIEPSKPLGVASSAVAEVQPGCIRLIVDGQPFSVSSGSRGDSLYLPAENAYYRIKRFWSSDARAYIEGESKWTSCSPQAPIALEEAGMLHLKPWVTRRNPDGSYSCRSGFSWFGG